MSMDEQVGKRCGDCRYGLPVVNGEGVTIHYECRHSPPSVDTYAFRPGVVESIRRELPLFPKMQADDWCFQWHLS